MLLGCGHSSEVFQYHGVGFVELGRDAERPLTDAAVTGIVRRFEPGVVVTGTVGPVGSGLDYRLIRAARRLNVPTLGILDAWMNYSSRFADPATGAKLAYLPDVLAVMDEGTIDEMAAEGIPRGRLRVTGHPFLRVLYEKADGLDQVSQRRRSLGVSPDDRLLVFFSEPLRWLSRHSEYEDHGSGYDELDAYRIVCDAVGRLPGDNVLVVREHPRRASLPRAQAHRGNVRVIRQSRLDPVGLIIAADVVVGMSSTLLVYAYLMGRKVVVVQPGLDSRSDRNMLTRRCILPNLQTAAQVSRHITDEPDARPEILSKARRDLKWGGRSDVLAAELALDLYRNGTGARMRSFPSDGALSPGNLEDGALEDRSALAPTWSEKTGGQE